jgi:hypothetical protein
MKTQLIYRILTSSCQFPFKEEEIERPGEETVVDFVAASPADVRSTLALTGHDVAVVVVSAAGVAVARFAAVRVFEEKNKTFFNRFQTLGYYNAKKNIYFNIKQKWLLACNFDGSSQMFL